MHLHGEDGHPSPVGRPPTAPAYTHAELLTWIEDVRRKFTQDRLIARLPYDRHFIAGMAQGLPELSWCVASARVQRLHPHLSVESRLQKPEIVPNSRREVGLVAFEGKLLCPRGQPDTLVDRVLHHVMATTIKAMDGRWDNDAYLLACVEVKPVDRSTPFDGVFAPAGLNAPAEHVAMMFQEHRARHLAARSLDQSTPLVSTGSTGRRI